jgi:hypothetical protein
VNSNVFLEKYCSRHIPSESTIRKNYVDSLHEEVMDELKSTISNNFVWFSVDETTDVCGRYIANLIIGILHEESPTKAFLIASKDLEKQTATQLQNSFMMNSQNFFYQTQFLLKKILLMVFGCGSLHDQSSIKFKNFLHKFNSLYMPSSWFKSGCGNYSIAVSFSEHFNFTR